MKRALVAVALPLVAVTAGCGSSSGPDTVLSAAVNVGVVGGCADVRTASTDAQAGDEASAASALQDAVTALRKPPVDPTATPTADTIATRLAGGDTAGALAAGTAFCARMGQ